MYDIQNIFIFEIQFDSYIYNEVCVYKIINESCLKVPQCVTYIFISLQYFHLLK